MSTPMNRRARAALLSAATAALFANDRPVVRQRVLSMVDEHGRAWTLGRIAGEFATVLVAFGSLYVLWGVLP